MVNVEPFKEWLQANTTYSAPVIRDTASRVKRADAILEWNDEEVYQFYLERTEQYKLLSPTVRSQLKKAVRLYWRFDHNHTP